jgi:glucose-6-phosphate dehydrogenase assembly protein OpcA
VVYSEEITLVGPSGAEGHFGAMVRALQVPGVRTATLWMDAAMPSTLLTRELMPVTRRLIVDTGSCTGPLHLQDLERLAARMRPRPVADLGWLRLSSFRLLFAGLFDRLAVRYRRGGDVSALLLVSWLGELLGWRPLRAAETSDGGLRFEFDRPDGGSLEAFVIPSAGSCDQSAILAIEIGNGSDAYVVSREAIDQARLQLPIAPARAVKLDAYSDADICVAALGPRGRDPLFTRCLEYAGRLWALAPRGAGNRQ